MEGNTSSSALLSSSVSRGSRRWGVRALAGVTAVEVHRRGFGARRDEAAQRSPSRAPLRRPRLARARVRRAGSPVRIQGAGSRGLKCVRSGAVRGVLRVRACGRAASGSAGNGRVQPPVPRVKTNSSTTRLIPSNATERHRPERKARALFATGPESINPGIVCRWRSISDFLSASRMNDIRFPSRAASRASATASPARPRPCRARLGFASRRYRRR